ncbi:response regulator [Streptacidiphilus sp. P02-A3a]|uniref:response regulator n=1 Tax=Streptacidiphilus sp. P02-A3a TaxID=2704468 RepID=UPI0015FC2246|nr:response regulator [Streptacidiphilus sp. P02-A3a]QMU73409.1 response regulator transcription factor [Streptacidiphilus sp. P02-A3a]
MARPGSPLETPGGDGPPAAGSSPLPESDGQPVRLLLVDRDVRVRAAIHQTIVLESDLTIVAEAADAARALVMAAHVGPSVALVDLLLPDPRTGLDLVRALSRGHGCAVVAMSARGGLREAALAAGAFALVDKSGDIDAILTAVRAAAEPGLSRRDRTPGPRAAGGGRGRS